MYLFFVSNLTKKSELTCFVSMKTKRIYIDDLFSPRDHHFSFLKGSGNANQVQFASVIRQVSKPQDSGCGSV